MGSLANKELREVRQLAHEAFDTYWKCGSMSRSKAYSMLAKAMRMPRNGCHIGMLDTEACYQVIEVCRGGMK